MEAKAVDFKFDEGFLVVTVDLNKDGDNLLVLKLNLAEIPDEVLAAFKKK